MSPCCSIAIAEKSILLQMEAMSTMVLNTAVEVLSTVQGRKLSRLPHGLVQPFPTAIGRAPLDYAPENFSPMTPCTIAVPGSRVWGVDVVPAEIETSE